MKHFEDMKSIVEGKAVFFNFDYRKRARARLATGSSRSDYNTIYILSQCYQFSAKSSKCACGWAQAGHSVGASVPSCK